MRTLAGLLALATAVAAGAEPTPARVASLSPAATRMLVDLGCADRVALATRWCELPEGHPAEREADPLAPDLERLARLRPDLVVIPRLANPLLAARARSLGLPLLVLSRDAPDAPARDILRLGERLGAAEAARRLVAARDFRLKGERRLLVVWDGVCAGPESHLAWVAAASGHVLAPDAGTWPSWDREQVGRWRPDVVIYLATDGPRAPERDAGRLDEWRADPALRGTAAAVKGEIYRVRSDSKWLPASGLPEAAALVRSLGQVGGVR